ncbi:MAG: anti-sigma factor antagonist [Deltaproteobacteria bacterium]|nr:MAG: anti-sigma factor antagonist [Deltaproteobacteria bacterium]
MQNKNEVTLKKQGSVVIFNIQGDITSFSEPFLNQAYKEANDQGTEKILLNLEEGAYINSGGIAVLIQILAQTKKNNQQISITGLSEHFKKIFNMVGITKFADIHNDVESAIAVMSK